MREKEIAVETEEEEYKKKKKKEREGGLNVTEKKFLNNLSYM